MIDGQGVSSSRALTGRRIAALLLMVLCSSTVTAFQVDTRSGERVDLLDVTGKGRWTLLMVWSLDCIPCEQQKPMIEAFYQDHADKDAHVVGLVLDGRVQADAIDRRVAEGVTTFPHLLALPDVFARQFREATGEPFRATPTYWLFDPQGQSVGVHVGLLTRADLELIVARSP